jgi:hypothetical protein
MVPWVRADQVAAGTFTKAGQEVSILRLSGGYSSACDAYYDPKGNVLPANTYELRIYAMGQNFRYLAGKLTLGNTGTQRLAVCMAAREWDVAIGLLLNVAAPPAFPNGAPQVAAYAHGRERS